MKDFKRLIIIFAGLMAAGLLVLLVSMKNSGSKERDIAYYNNELITMEDEYRLGASIDELEQKHGCRIIDAS